ncbi:unnamed protein product [Porites lobata]|uniref:Uncharacterized protein n=1 Tax=Porites lobata TaxID=104759 RepID=A0ABN8QD10_9CNID|nr:unnamed protein product [Porites lobata]
MIDHHTLVDEFSLLGVDPALSDWIQYYQYLKSWQDIPEYLSVKLESIQRQALKIVFPDYTYDEALTVSGLESLEKR